MKALHVTSIAEYRSPYGAAILGGAVTLRLDTWEGMARSCYLRLWQEGIGETIVPMTPVDACAPDGTSSPCRRFETVVNPETLGVLWYSFRMEACDGSIVWYGAKQGWTSGEGSLYGYQPPSFQMTVYAPRDHIPQWYVDGVVYQVFPDRFSRDDNWRLRSENALAKKRKGPHRVLVDDWNTYPSYVRAENGDILQWDFYGGSFKGIQEKLPYLVDLGVTVLYLNPIFEAASNHRYDTADYLRVDSMLGTIDEFKELCVQAGKVGISIILDGVFNHSGQDSVYFNSYGNYSNLGAFQSEESPYRDWFTFYPDGSYSSWWGIKDLPDYNEDSPSLREFFCGQNGVIRTWLRAGAKGWRLDVADELPDSFIVDIKAAALAENPDAIVIGEVWEDASNKYAYGQLRHYFQGQELDGVMNYPFRTAVIEYLTGVIGAQEAAARLRQLHENYPEDNFACNLNLLGSHDRERIFTMLGGAPSKDSLTDDQRFAFRLDDQQRYLAENRIKLATALQMTAPGVPCIYYGDERAMEGFSDPYNRAPMDWSNNNQAVFDAYRSAVALRKSHSLFVDGAFQPFAVGNEVLGWWRRSDDEAGEAMCVMVNRSPWDSATISVDAAGETVTELARAESAAIVDGRVTVTLKPFDVSVLYFHHVKRLHKPLEDGKGIIAHITSLPNQNGPGTLGAPAFAFVDWLAANGYGYWQLLPVNPTDSYGSPYAGLSAFAGNPALIEWPQDKQEYLDKLLQENNYQAFLAENQDWLLPYATFRAIKAVVGEVPWQQWIQAYQSWNPYLPNSLELVEEIDRVCAEQYAFQIQWKNLKSYANGKGVSIIGDIPMYVSADSADVWAHKGLFDLDEAGNPSGLAGVPPDAMAEDGQIWGNPTYDWSAMAADGYAWWLNRLKRMFDLYDYVRLDHFLGFSSYYVIQAGKKATEGTWKYGPGYDFFQLAYQYFGGPLPLIAENLGTITPAVRGLTSRCGFPGMDVIQFADTDPRAWYAPAPNSLIYLSTHDTPTLIGWCQQKFGLSRDDAEKTAEWFKQANLGRSEGVVMMQLQDALGLGDEARMNVPGVAEGNWKWQAESLVSQ